MGKMRGVWMVLRGGGKGGVVVGVLFRSGRLARFIVYFFFLRHIWTSGYPTFTLSMYFVPYTYVPVSDLHTPFDRSFTSPPHALHLYIHTIRTIDFTCMLLLLPLTPTLRRYNLKPCDHRNFVWHRSFLMMIVR